jgi:hypothetical protein
MTVMDDDKDILAGRYLNEDEQIAAGTSFIIDIFELCIVHQIMQVKDVCADPVNLVDLTSECPVANPDRRIGGRFWVLADGVEDDEEEDVSAAADELKNFQDEEGDPSAMAEELQLVPTRATEIQKQDVFSREGNRRHERPAKRQVKPWIGPIPKVCVKPVTLSDFLPDDWTFVTRRKKKKRRAAGLPPAMVIWFCGPDRSPYGSRSRRVRPIFTYELRRPILTYEQRLGLAVSLALGSRDSW